MLPIARALDHAHGLGVLHLDLKPSNIMLTADDDPQVMDFGLAKRDAGEITMTVEGKVLGTPAYIPPEQARGEGRKAVSERLEELEHGGLFPLGQFAFIDIKGAISQSQRGNQAGLTIPTNPITGGA